MRRFAVIGQTALASPDFSLLDIPGTSGRLDVLLRCVRAALLVSHGLRRDTIIYLVLLGGAPTTIRIDGSSTKYIRPDERHLGTTLKKVLSLAPDDREFVEVRAGIATARRGVDAVLADSANCERYLLDEGGADIRAATVKADALFILGDHRGFPDGFAVDGATHLSLGPVSVQADDAIALIHNELDRR